MFALKQSHALKSFVSLLIFVELVLEILRQVLGYKMLDYNTCTELFHKIRERINIIEDGEVARCFLKRLGGVSTEMTSFSTVPFDNKK